MKAITHIYASAVLGGIVYTVSKSAAMSLTAFLSGFLIDLDHLLDFFLLSDQKFSISVFFDWFHNDKWDKIVVIFHSYELYVLLAITAYHFPNHILQGLVYGIGLHLLLDQVWNCYLGNDNHLSVWLYFLSYRIYAGFHKNKLRSDKRA